MLAVFLVCTLPLKAQDVKVIPVRPSRIKPLHASVGVYAAGSRICHESLTTANNTRYNYQPTYGKYVDAGVTAELCRNRGIFQYIGSVGYKYNVYNYSKSMIGDSGVDSHWISTDLKAEVSYVGLGVQSDIHLFSKVRNNDYFSYNGLYPETFNSATLCWYLSGQLRFTRLKLEARVGSYIIPHLNPNKIAYYNLTDTTVNNLYFECRLSYRIFTTGRVRSIQSLF